MYLDINKGVNGGGLDGQELSCNWVHHYSLYTLILMIGVTRKENMSEVEKLRERIIDNLHWKEFKFIGQNNTKYEGFLTQESEEYIAALFLYLIKQAGYLPVEPVKLEVLGDEEIKEELKKYYTEEQMEMPKEIYDIVCGIISIVRQATNAHNEAKGQLYRRIDGH